jgi:HEPN domain-containing protein
MSSEASTKFYSEAKSGYYDWLDKAADAVFIALRLASVSDGTFLPRFMGVLEAKRGLTVYRYMGKIPAEHYSKFSRDMRDSFTKYSKNAFRGDYLIEVGLRRFDKDHWWSECKVTREGSLPDRAKYYLEECVKCYLVSSYDACIVMGGRATEFSIKESLRRNGTSFNEKDTLHEIWGKFKGILGNKPRTDASTLEKVEELVRVYRNVTAHDNPKSATREEAELVYHSAKLVCNQILAPV